MKDQKSKPTVTQLLEIIRQLEKRIEELERKDFNDQWRKRIDRDRKHDDK